jgi:hypothetical protein
MQSISNKACAVLAALTVAGSMATSLALADGSESIATKRTIGYVTTDLHWAF